MRLLLTLLLSLLAIASYAQKDNSALGEAEFYCNINDMLPEGVDVKGSTQGFAIYEGYGFSMHDKGQCVIFDIKSKKFINTFLLEGNTGHCNNASFGVERYSRESQFPLFYVSECRGERACYVNDISTTGSRLVQKIFYDGEEITGPCDWAVDREQRRLYLYCTIANLRMLKWFALPSLSDSDSNGEVHLGQEDMLGSIPAGAIAIPQGSHIFNHRVYLAQGIPPRTTSLHCVDARSAKPLSIIDFTHTGLEPEGIATYKGWLYLSFHTPRQPRHNIIYRLRIEH